MQHESNPHEKLGLVESNACLFHRPTMAPNSQNNGLTLQISEFIVLHNGFVLCIPSKTTKKPPFVIFSDKAEMHG